MHSFKGLIVLKRRVEFLSENLQFERFLFEGRKSKKGIQERHIEGGNEKERMIKQNECGHGNNSDTVYRILIF